LEFYLEIAIQNRGRRIGADSQPVDQAFGALAIANHWVIGPVAVDPGKIIIVAPITTQVDDNNIGVIS
jgi:hypothetical protein